MIRTVMSWLIIILAVVNLTRMAIFLIATDWYDVKRQLQHRGRARRTKRAYRPLMSVIIPAHNEEMGVIRTVESVLANEYRRIEVIVVDDGSSDRTLSLLRAYKRRNKLNSVTIVTQKNGGKASAINNALRNYAKGALVMVLDADSLLDSRAIKNMVHHFSDQSIVASAANVKILDDNRLIGLAQRIEYLVSYRLKRALTVLNMEYIIGGVGSTFRRSAVRKVEYYDTDTITEDIDFTLKLIVKNGNKIARIHYAADAVAYTEAVMTYAALIKQRFRWKYGRMQSFVKHKVLFMSRNKLYDKRLTWANLPYAILGEIALLLEPFMFAFVVTMSFLYGDSRSLLSVYAIITIYVASNVLAENTETARGKARLMLGVPIAYGLMYVLTLVELVALVKSLARMPDLFRETMREGKWDHVARAGAAEIIL